MQSRVFRWGFLSRWATCLVVTAAVSGCDAAPEERGAELRSGEFDDESKDGVPQPNSVEDIDGGVNIGCPECGSHWTIVGGILAVYLAPDLGDAILPLSDHGTLRFKDKLGHFTKDDVHQGQGDYKGYTIEIRSFSKPVAEAHDIPGGRETAELRVHHQSNPVFVHLRYVDDDSSLFADPPAFE